MTLFEIFFSRKTASEEAREIIRNAIRKKGIKNQDMVVVRTRLERYTYRILVSLDGYWNEEGCVEQAIRCAIKEAGYVIVREECDMTYVQFDIE